MLVFVTCSGRQVEGPKEEKTKILSFPYQQPGCSLKIVWLRHTLNDTSSVLSLTANIHGQTKNLSVTV